MIPGGTSVAVVFDKNLTFKEKLSEYKKDVLKAMAEELGLKKLSRLKKGELAELVAECILSPEVFFYRAAILTDKEAALMDKALDGPVAIAEHDLDMVCHLNEMDLAVVSQGEYLIPCDVAQSFKKIRTPEFESYRKRASWVWMCIDFAEKFYGVTPVKKMLDLVNCKKGFRMTEEELVEIYEHFPKGDMKTQFADEMFLETSFLEDLKKLDDLVRIQAKKEYYIPRDTEVVEYYETRALLSDKLYQDIFHYMESELGMAHDQTEDILYELWDMTSSGEDLHDTIQWFLDQFEFANKKQAEKLLDLYMMAANETRMLSNRGHKPKELRTARAIQQTPAAKMPKKINKQMTAAKKVYPNDPCPCGSGKKYKKCCGRN